MRKSESFLAFHNSSSANSNKSFSPPAVHKSDVLHTVEDFGSGNSSNLFSGLPLNVELAAASASTPAVIAISPNQSNASRVSFSSLDDTYLSLFGDINVTSDETTLKKIFKNILTRLDDLEVVNTLQKKNISQLENHVRSLEKNVLVLSENNDKLTKTCSEFEKKCTDFEIQLIEAQQYTRRESLVISGIPESVGQDVLETTVIDILRTVGVRNVSSYEITAVHRLAKRRNDKYPAKTIVRFTNRKIVNVALELKKNLRNVKGMNLRFFESLCSSNKKILHECSRLKNAGFISNYFLRNGFVKIIQNVDDNPKKIRHLNDIKNKFPDFYNELNIYDNLYMT